MFSEILFLPNIILTNEKKKIMFITLINHRNCIVTEVSR